jgi:hypothetical protein
MNPQTPATPPDPSPRPVRLTQSDTARLLGCSRQHISTLVKSGRVPCFPDGRLDPSAVVSALLQGDPATVRLKALVDIRRRIEDAEARAHDATGERDRMAERLAELAGGFRELARRYVESESWLNRFRDRLDADAEIGCEFLTEELLDLAFDAAAHEVLGAPLSELCKGLDPDVLAMIARLDPESGIQPSPLDRTEEAGTRPGMGDRPAELTQAMLAELTQALNETAVFGGNDAS